MLKNIVVLSVVFAVSACAGAKPEGQSVGVKPMQVVEEKAKPANQMADDDMICRTERPIGSNRTKRICRTRVQIEQDRSAAQQAVSEKQGGM